MRYDAWYLVVAEPTVRKQPYVGGLAFGDRIAGSVAGARRDLQVPSGGATFSFVPKFGSREKVDGWPISI